MEGIRPMGALLLLSSLDFASSFALDFRLCFLLLYSSQLLHVVGLASTSSMWHGALQYVLRSMVWRIFGKGAC